MDKIAQSIDAALVWLGAMLLPLAVALAARGGWYLDQLRRGNRTLAAGMILGEGCTAFLCAVVGAGLAEHLGLRGNTALALIGVLSWLGPGGTFALLRPLIERRIGGK